MSRKQARRALRWGGLLGPAVALLALLGLGVGIAIAGKPQPPSPPADGGLIYWVRGDAGVIEYLVMKPDGSGKTTRPPGMPSTVRHDGERWFSTFVPGEGTYPSGGSVVRVRIATASGRGVDLALPDLIEPAVTLFDDNWANHQGEPDGKMTFLAKQWRPDWALPYGLEDLAAWGVYAVVVNWTAVLASASTTFPVLAPTLLGFAPAGDIGYPTRGDAWLNARYAWSADGTSLVFSPFPGVSGVRGVWRTDDQGDGTWTPPYQLAADVEQAESVAWHGNSVLYSKYRWVWKIPDDQFTAQPTVIVELRSDERVRGSVRWSPQGTNILYPVQRLDPHSPTPRSWDIFRALPDGSRGTNLTNDLTGSAWAQAWRTE